MPLEEEDDSVYVVFQLQRKEMLQQLLAMLSSASVLHPQTAAPPRWESQPHVSKER